MSDDEYYDDEYADFHDMLYDADPDPDLADDLAEHAAHSPVYIDNPNEEARVYFSDWEYYSDDYFDDDPALLGKISKNETENKAAPRSNQQSAKRGRKRKLSEARERSHSDTKELRALKACMQGTVWKTKSPELEEDYDGGKSQPVALRLNKAIMRSAYSTKKGFGTGRAAKDESWANDLSLADMGLRTEKSIDLQHGSSVANGEVSEEGDEEAEDEESDNDGDVGIDQEMIAEEVQMSNIDGHQQRPDEHQAKRRPTIQGQMNGISIQDSDEEGEQRRKKRRRVVVSESSTANKSSFVTPETPLDPELSDTAMDIEPTQAVLPKKGRGRPKRQPIIGSQHSINIAAPKSALSHTRPLSQNESTVTASTASSRAKKNASASAVPTSTKTSRPAASKITKTTRKTRSQQK